jgi:hypothetical protein
MNHSLETTALVGLYFKYLFLFVRIEVVHIQ